eukprot:gnl/TRDRNA2_/TRDRNA2_151364_c1_seq1.p1 gnl/TRDRNA2_/TRDRNA2_151364_c1~~gnl/TRDRNA2_/TRDRNA2_151364_c1_seq1.p1  ORF type:complete len:335 (-),score=54.67 gnl/TRDRNA2_/TRDRNA2_151364_c1_seq1:135-1139(-)
MSSVLSEGHGPVVSAAEAELFRREGYLVKHDFFQKQEVEAMRRQLSEIRAAGYTHDMSTVPNKGHHVHLGSLMDSSRLFRALAWKDEVKAAIETLIGTQNKSTAAAGKEKAEPAFSAVVNAHQYFLKVARTGLGTNWHQDNVYFRVPDPLSGVAMWIAVDDCSLENGTLHVIPGSHLHNNSTTLEHKPFAEERGRYTCASQVREADALPCCTKAGGVVFFCYGCAHCTRDNLSSADRAGVAYHFLTVNQANAKTKGVFGNRNIDEKHSPSPWIDDGQRLYGEIMKGRWAVEVEAALQPGAGLSPTKWFAKFAKAVKKHNENEKDKEKWVAFAKL